ncbi:MAG TPA: YlbF family regulator [Bacilli bacterium]|nr:YlbF family regulator [Bacilli bacterium]
MDKIAQLTDELASDLQELPEIKEFLRLKKLMETNKELADMRSNIARLTQDNKEEEKANLLAIYNSHPLVNNYNIAKEEAARILRTIQNILSE